MALLSDHKWKSKYTPDDGDLVQRFYVQALDAAVRYDRSTGYFSASALALAARGIEALVRNNGKMRLLVGCTLDQDETDAIAAGYDLRETVTGRLMKMPLLASDADHREVLELLSWMVARGLLDVKVAIPKNEAGKPIPDFSLFHEKAGVIEDKTGDRVAFSGSINETAAGWKLNWESFHVFCSWAGGDAHIQAEEESFARLWEDRSSRAWVLEIHDAIGKALLPFLPAGDAEPARVVRLNQAGEIPTPASPPPPPPPSPIDEKRRETWDFIHSAATRPDGARVGEATSAVVPWPHQLRAFHRMHTAWPPRLLIADEVGLGKTIEAGLLLRQAWLSGRARRILVLAPKAVLTQWQIELREKFNLDWPIYDGDSLVWQATPAHREGIVRQVSRQTWHKEPFVIASSHLMRRRERQTELILDAEPWDLVVLDEAHHARRKNPGAAGEGGPNLLLRLMQGMVQQQRALGLLLLTATPMQVHPVEVWDLVSLLGLPAEWSAQAFLEYFLLIAKGNPSHPEFDKLAALFRAMERRYGETPLEAAQALVKEGSRLKAKRLLGALRDPAGTPRRQLGLDDRRAALDLLKARSPLAVLISRHTRDLLRAYFKAGKITTPIAERRVLDQFLPMTDAERAVYEAVEDYISTTYDAAASDEKTSVGFVMTIYRRRLSSSFAALIKTLQTRLDGLSGKGPGLLGGAEDLPDDETAEDVIDVDDAQEMERRALQREERTEIARLIELARKLPTDTKARALVDTVHALQEQAYAQAIVFTQYTDTLDFLRDVLVAAGLSVMCFSGRGGEVMLSSGAWKTVSREDTKRRFRNGDAEVLLCTDAAAEGLNFQFCGALVNYDAPWNPMRVEQRIGRIDRLGQKFEKIAVVNLMYDDTVEADVYAALRNRIGLFTTVVGKLQPILSRLPHRIAEAALAGREERSRLRANLLSTLEGEIAESESEAFDIDAATRDAMTIPSLPAPPLTMTYLAGVLRDSDLLPPGVEVEQRSEIEFSWRAPGMPEALRVTTDLDFYEAHPSSVEFWSAGSPLFPSGN
jgi:ERCC4-related helicase